MNENLIEQLTSWHNKSQYTKIIQAIEKLPASELTYELKNHLGRAYNNESEYGKALEVLLSASLQGADDALWNFRVGYAYYYNDEPAKALPFFQQSAALGDTTAPGFIEDCLRDAEKTMENQPVAQRSAKTINNIAWSFSKNRYTDAAEFNQEVVRYQKAIFQTDEHWKPAEIAFGFPELQIQYEAWIMQPADLLENESLTEDDESVFEQYPDEKQHQVEIIAKLKADNGSHFTALEFLMKAHNQQANKELGDHVFFEGTDEDPEMVNGLPTCYIACGS